MLRSDDVPDSGFTGRGARASQPAHPSDLQEARTSGDRSQPGLVLGHTRLPGPVKWTYYYLYVILDIYSRYVVGWMLADRENTDLARLLIAESCDKQGIRAGQLTIHSDRGAVMQSKGLAQLLADLGITKTNSRPHVSNDNPFSESQFKTMKYRPQFPQRFGSQTDGRFFCRSFFDWYNREHYHSAMAYLTPETVHYGRASEALSSRQRLLIGLHHQPEQVHRRTTSGHPTARGRLDQSTKRRFNDRAAVSINSPGRLSQNA